MSGTFETLKYPNTKKHLTELHALFHDEDYDSPQVGIPVPKYYWKVVYDKESHSAAAFLGLNDIYAHDVTKTRCPSVCHQLSEWVDFDYDEMFLGHVTCCSLDTFAQVVSFAPNYK